MQWVLVVETCWWQTSVERISDRNAPLPKRREVERSSFGWAHFAGLE
jgi:hypothetical protein